MIADGVSRAQILGQFGLNKNTLAGWVRQERKKDPLWVSTTRLQNTRGHKVGHVRQALRMLDEGVPLKRVERVTGHTCKTLRRWRDEPRYREATLEYDPLFTYDHTDLMDRAVVAHRLCAETRNVGERLDLLMAVIGSPELDQFSIPSRKNTRRKSM